MIIICVSLDYLFSNYLHTNKFTFISSISLILTSSITYSYFKYLIEFKYYYYLDILYIYGIFSFFWSSVSLSLIILVHKVKGTNRILFEFYDYYNINTVLKIVFRIFYELIIIGIISDMFEFIILDKLTPNYIIILYEMSKMPANIINFVVNIYNNLGKYKVLILIAILVLSILHAITLLFYLEIFEFYFCELNKNTKKNIEEREKILSNENISVDNESDIAIEGYKIEDGIKNTHIEMVSPRESSVNPLN